MPLDVQFFIFVLPQSSKSFPPPQGYVVLKNIHSCDNLVLTLPLFSMIDKVWKICKCMDGIFIPTWSIPPPNLRPRNIFNWTFHPTGAIIGYNIVLLYQVTME